MNAETIYWTAVTIGCLATTWALLKGARKHLPVKDRDQQQPRTIRATVTPGAYTEQWCDGCNRTHGVVTLYAYRDDDPTTARPVGMIVMDEDEGDA
ncbi:MAG: hypothetical protein QJR09_11970 [Micrococcus sp.]|nr:hypothetical protein [Micrococcus sp.]